MNGSIPGHEATSTDGDVSGLSRAARTLSIREDIHRTPSLTTSSDLTSGPNAHSGLLTRRGARRISPPLLATSEQPSIETSSGHIEYLRPITPTEPLMGDDEINESSLRTPTTTDMLVNDGPMTPTNNAGPFVFDGSAGRASG